MRVVMGSNIGMKKHKWLLIISMCNILAWTEQPRVLLMYPWYGNYFSGLSVYHYNHQTMFLRNNIYTVTLSLNNVLATKLLREGYAVDIAKQLITEEELLDSCRKNKITVIVTPDIFLLPMIKRVARQHALHIVYMRHATIDDLLKNNISMLTSIDAALGVNPDITAYLEQANTEHNLGIPYIAWVPPFWDEQECCKFKPLLQSKSSFFKERFGITMADDTVVLCVVANLVPGKNHVLMLKAIAHIIQQHPESNIKVIFAGDGILRSTIQKHITAMHLDAYVHLVGSINYVPTLFHYADIHVLPSEAEGFPLANMEAAYSKKAIVTTRLTGAAYLLEEGISGLLFDGNDEISLAETLYYLIVHPELRIRLGENAYERMIGHFTNQKIYDRWKMVLNSLTDTRK